jgi:uncharacterized membrane protein YqiK
MDSKKPIEQVLKLLVTSVKGASKGRQEPWSEGSFEGDFCFGGCEDENAEKNRLAAEISLWESVIGSTSINDYERYLSAYPAGTFAALAKKTIDNLKTAANRPTPSQSQENTNSTIARIEREKAELLKQAEEVKKQELARLEREKAERDKFLALSEEKLKLEAANRQKLEAELVKAKQDAESFRKNQTAQESSQPPKKLFVSPSF